MNGTKPSWPRISLGRDEAIASAVHRKAKEKDNWSKAIANWDDFGGQLGCGYKPIAKKHSVSAARLKLYKDGEYCDSLSSGLLADSGGDDSGDDDSDQTF